MAKGSPKAILPGRRPRGRPALPPEAGKRHPLGIRTTAELKKKIEAAAAESGRSIAQEIELRLERSFDQDTMLARVIGRLDEFEEELLRTRSRGLKVFRDAARKRRKE